MQGVPAAGACEGENASRTGICRWVRTLPMLALLPISTYDGSAAMHVCVGSWFFVGSDVGPTGVAHGGNHFIFLTAASTVCGDCASEGGSEDPWLVSSRNHGAFRRPIRLRPG